MLSHIVVFWLKDDLSVEQKDKFCAGLESLKKIDFARVVHIGTPAATADRTVIDKSYSFAINSVFQSMSDQDQYQIHPLHQAFLQECVPMCARVKIYDFE